MGIRKPHDKAIFAWQAVLILLPVLILAGVGFSFLRQDRALLRREAEARAQEIANALLPKCLEALSVTNLAGFPAAHVFMVDSSGDLVAPPPLPAFLAPELLDLDQLRPEQREAWREMQELEGSSAALQTRLEAGTKIV